MTLSSNVRTPEEFDRWARDAEPGDVVVYYTGNHAHGDMCRAAMALEGAGLVCLVRRRVDTEGSRRFQFEAQRTKTKHVKKQRTEKPQR